MVIKIDELLIMPIVGNAAGDRSLFDAAHLILMDGAESTENKMLALMKIDEAMGLNSDITFWDVQEYIDSFEAPGDCSDGNGLD